MKNYRILEKKGEGTFSEVMRALHLPTGKQYAVKCMKRSFDSVAEVNRLPEIQALRNLSGHPYIVQLHEVLYDERRLAIVFELMDMNVYEVIKDRKSYLPESRVTRWMHQLFQAISFMHKNNTFHRDVKPENLLISDDVLKLADLGSCCPSNNRRPFTEYISTRWYRAPECLLTSGHYTQKMDVWAAGCVFYELMSLNPLFPGKNELDQIHRIHSILGTPNQTLFDLFRSQSGEHLKDMHFSPVRGSGFDKKLSHCSRELVAYIYELVAYDASKRPNASQALNHSFFAQLKSDTENRKQASAGSTEPSSSPRDVTPRRPVVPPLVLSGKPLHPSLKSARSKSHLAAKLFTTRKFRYLSQTYRSHIFPVLATTRNHHHV